MTSDPCPTCGGYFVTRPCPNCSARPDPAGTEPATSEPWTDEDRETVESIIRGIDAGRWNPTPATKRYLARLLRAALIRAREIQREREREE